MLPAGRHQDMSRREKIRLVRSIIVAGFGAAVVYHFVQAVWFNNGYPYSTFLFSPADRFGDFFANQNAARTLNPYLGSGPTAERIYLPFLYLVAFLFAWLPGLSGLCLFLAIFLGSFMLISYHNLKVEGDTAAGARDVMVFSLLSYPVLFTIDRANLEALVFLPVCLFLYFYRKDRMLPSILSLACAIAMKFLPAVFVVLFLADRKYREAVWTLAAAAAVTALSFLLIHGAMMENVDRLLLNLRLHAQLYIVAEGGVSFGHSLWGMLTVLIDFIYRHFLFGSPADLPLGMLSLRYPYLILTLIVFFFITAYIVLVEREFWKRTCLLVLSMNLLPYISANYKLLYVFIPLFLFLNSPIAGRKDAVYAVILALLLVPKHYIPLDHYDAWSEVVIDPLLMTAGMALIVQEGLKARRLERSGGTPEPSAHNIGRVTALCRS